MVAFQTTAILEAKFYVEAGQVRQVQVAQTLSASAAPSVKGEVLVSQGVMRNKITNICKTLSTGPGPLSPLYMGGLLSLSFLQKYI